MQFIYQLGESLIIRLLAHQLYSFASAWKFTKIKPKHEEKALQIQH